MACLFSFPTPPFLSHIHTFTLCPPTPLFFFLHPSSVWLSSLATLIMNRLCFCWRLSHFPSCPLIWSPPLLLLLLLFVSHSILVFYFTKQQTVNGLCSFCLSAPSLFGLALRVMQHTWPSSVSHLLLFASPCCPSTLPFFLHFHYMHIFPLFCSLFYSLITRHFWCTYPCKCAYSKAALLSITRKDKGR